MCSSSFQCQLVHISTEEARLDPNDPRNMKFLHLLQSVPTTTDESVAKVFRLKLLHEKERLVSDEEFARERRFALLEHRHRGVSLSRVAGFYSYSREEPSALVSI